jgi:DHA3 family tetracycline resistance protein-like MFS transporter
VSGALQVPVFRWLFAGQAVSAIGDQVFPVAVAALVVTGGGTAGELGLVLAARFGALVLFALLGGVWADRLPRVRVLRGADLLRLVAVAGLAVAAASGTPPVVVLAGLVFLVGAGEAFFRPAFGALLPTVLPADSLAAGNALSSTAQQLALVVGPGLAGGLLLVGETWVVFAVDALTFAVSLATLLKVTEPPRAPAPRRRMVAEMAEGVAAVRARPWVGAVLLVATTQLLVISAPLMVLLPVVVGDPSAYGLVLAVGAVGGLLGALACSRWRPAHRGRVGLLLLMTWAAPPLALLAQAPTPVLAGAWFLAHLGTSPFIIWWETALQASVPRELLARVVSLDWLCSLALLPAGLALTGPVVSLVGRTPVLLAAAGVALVSSGLPLLVPGVVDFRSPAKPITQDRAGCRR